MAIVTTYVCDVTGKSGTDKTQFVEVEIKAQGYQKTGEHTHSFMTPNYIKRLIHIDVANKFNLIIPPKDKAPQPEVTFEGKLRGLLEDFVQEIVDGNLANR